jgi:hypothetical protein
VPRRNSVSAFFVPPRRYQFYYGSRPFSRILTNKPERNPGDMTHKELLTKYRAKYGAASLKDLKTRARKASDSGNTGTKQTRSNQPTAHGSAADTVPFGKYRGEKFENLLSDENYVEWILVQPGMVEQWKRRNPAFGRLLAEAIGGGALVRQSRVQLQKLAQEIGEIYKEARQIDATSLNPVDTEAYRACMDMTRKMRAILESLPLDASEEHPGSIADRHAHVEALAAMVA